MPRPEGRPEKGRVRANFARAAARYDGFALLQAEVRRRLLGRLDWLRRFEPRTVLDLGCGTGAALPELARRYPRARLLAVDLAHPMAAAARRRGRPWRRPWAVCGDAEALPLAGASVDLVFSNLTLQWCPRLEGALAEIARVLRPGGLVLFTTFGPDTLRELREAWAEADGGAHTHVNAFHDLHDVGDALVAAGLADAVADVERITMTYPDAYTLMGDLKGLGAANATAGRPRGLTTRRRLERVAAAYERFRRAEDGRLPATWEVVFGHAWGRAPLEVGVAGP
ncbi:malonyl-ACP O-methyltransferase BioC [Inmirania thermothiophila]|uniref:Malonyl-[acyl-carrier protein] O-methyltransferase n=1 Tax=Inmirania thermothiophila TaxID=1750597 RepID=A0A3N1Y6V9_9GAMM|nr:malonyl-ACP O-methyltransferase BioC [Inmirania thermothiophila]ROR34505.1 malonyl-CoA O-methyltransferase [Inmirania thermothiophila]